MSGDRPDIVKHSMALADQARADLGDMTET